MESAIAVRRTRGRPGVGVESAVLSSGLPADRRAEVIPRVRAAAGAAGVETLFVGVIGGRPIVGLEPAELDRLMGPEVRKVSVRDLPAAIAQRLDAGTTVAATLAIAHRAGLHVVVTGGIGGVHRGRGGHDVSADLLALTRTPAIVVCSGARPSSTFRPPWSGSRRSACPSSGMARPNGRRSGRGRAVFP